MKRKQPLRILLLLPTLAGPLAGQNYWDFTPPEDDFGPDAVNLKEVLGQDALTAADRVVVEGDRFEYAGTGEPVRFWGVNINAGRSGPDLAAYYAKRGVNAARYHSSKAIVSEDQQDYTLIDRERLDDLHRAIANFSAEGIHHFLSETFFPLSLRIPSQWGIDGYDLEYIQGGGQTRAFFILFFDEDLRGAFRGWLRQMVSTENPYNGLTIAEDPAVAAIELINEDNLFFWTFTPDNVPAEQWRKVEEALFDFVVEKYGSIEAAREAWGPLGGRFNADRDSEGRLRVIPAGGTNLPNLQGYTPSERRRVTDQMEFLATTQREWFAEMTQVLRDEGFEGGVIASNWRTSDRDLPTAESYLHDLEYWTYTAAGVLDNHSYFSPIINERASTGSVSPGDRVYAPPAVLQPRRLPVAIKQVEGHPSMVSEFAWVTPNVHRPEGALLISAYGSLKDLDALFWFAADGDGWRSSPGLSRWPVNLPSKAGQFPAAALMYRRGDVATSPVLLREGKAPASMFAAEPSLVKAQQGWDVTRDPDEFNYNPETGEGAIDSLALLAGRADLAFETDKDFTHPGLAELFSAEEQFVRSFTGEIQTDFGEGLSTVDTPTAKGIAGFLDAAGTVRLGEVRLRSNNEFASLLVVSLDGLPIAQSSRLLIQSGTQDRMTGWSTTSWMGNLGGESVEGFEVTQVGNLPWQVEETDARVILDITDRGVEEAVSLDANLRVNGSLRPLTTPNGITLNLPERAMYSLLELEPAENLVPVVTTAALPNAMQGESYTARLRAAGGDGDLSWEASGLPDGLSLAADGTLTGLPAEGVSGSYPVQVKVTDGDGDEASREVPLFVIDFTGTGPGSPWIDLPLQEGWRDTPLGWVRDDLYPFCYHNNHGWMYFIEQSPGNYFAYNYRDGLGWLYLSESFYPGGIFSYQYALWLLFVDNTGSEGAPRWFYDYTESTGEDGYFSLGG